MNIFSRITLRNLWKNKTRTLVTVIGIILSAAMITAVTVTISSFRKFLIDFAIKTDGNWNIEASGLDEHTITRLSEDDRVDEICYLNTEGFAWLNGCINDYKPYLCICSMSENFTENMPINITDGRLPKDDSEIILPDHLEYNGGIEHKLGDILSLKVGDRTRYNEVLCNDEPYEEPGYIVNELDQYVVDEESIERILDTKKVSYRVVGFYERPDYENYSAPGYTAIIGGRPKDIKLCKVFVRLKKIKETKSFFYDSDYFDSAVTSDFNYHLLRLNTASGESTYNKVLFGLGAVLIGIIVFGSITLIYNAFSISVSERTKQFGILSSVGATKKQLRKSVITEGVILGLIGIPLGVFAGVVGMAVTLKHTGKLLTEYLLGMEGEVTLKMHASVPALIIAFIIAALTIYISAYIPAAKGAKRSAIDSIKMTNDIKLTSRKIRVPWFTKKLFGFEGALATKNFKRNRKKYRATVMSLFVSVVLFVSASSFGKYLEKSVGMVYENEGFDIELYQYELPGNDDDENDIPKKDIGIWEDTIKTVYNSLMNLSSVKNITYSIQYRYETLYVDVESLNSEYIADNWDEDDLKTFMMRENVYGYPLPVSIIFLQDKDFKLYLAENSLSEEKYFNPEKPLAIVCESCRNWDADEERYTDVDVFTDINDANAIFSYYGINDTMQNTPIKFGDLVEEGYRMLPHSGYYVDIIFPFSQYENLLKDYRLFDCFYSIKSKDHKATVDELVSLARHNDWEISYTDYADEYESNRALLLLIDVFTYGFIILLSLIAAANVFNTISTNFMLRKREFAMLSAVGYKKGQLRKMLVYECLLYGVKGILYGLPVAFGVTFLIYKSILNGIDIKFFIPWDSVAIVIGAVFIVVFISMIYSIRKLERNNIIDDMRKENI